MTFVSWLRSLTRGSLATLKRPRASAARRRKYCHWQSAECLEVRALLSANGLGLAFGIGSTGTENALGVAADHSGNVLVAGVFTSASLDLDPGPGTHILPNAGGYDGYAAKYDPTGNLLWGVQVGGTGNSSVYKVEADGTGNVLIAGIFTGSVEIGAPGQPPVRLTTGGINEGFLAKFDPAGNALWARTFGAAADPRVAYGITTDAAGNVYATGSEGNRLFVAEYSADGVAVWTQVVSGTGTLANGILVQGKSVAVDTAGNVLVVGPYGGKIDFNPDPLKTSYLTSSGLFPGGSDTFVLKLNSAGAYVWAGSMGGPGQDSPSDVAVDGAGNVIVSGYYGSDSKHSKNDFDPGQGILSLPGSGGSFLVKLDPNRNLIWGRNVAEVRDMALDAAGNVYTTGRGGPDVYVSKLDSNGNSVWTADILRGVPGSLGVSFGIAVDGSGNVYTSGYFKGTADFDPGAGTYSLASTLDSVGNPTMDAFVSKLVPSSPLLAAAQARRTSVRSATSSPVTSFAAESSTTSSEIAASGGPSSALPGLLAAAHQSPTTVGLSPTSPVSFLERRDRATGPIRNASLNGVTIPFGRRPSPLVSDLADSTDMVDTLFIRWDDWVRLHS